MVEFKKKNYIYMNFKTKTNLKKYENRNINIYNGTITIFYNSNSRKEEVGALWVDLYIKTNENSLNILVELVQFIMIINLKILKLYL